MLRRKTTATGVTQKASKQGSNRTSPSPAGWDADDESGPRRTNMPIDPMRPATIAVPPRHTSPCYQKRPTLKEILSNTSQPPWSLTAFMAYLSSNHCLETLEFTMDAARYKKHYAKVLAKAGENGLDADSKEAANIKALWQRLIEAYIRPNGTREVNIPSEVRDPILNFDVSNQPPPPEALDIAVAKVYELMEESVLVPFLNSMSPRSVMSSSPLGTQTQCECDDSSSPREDKSMFRKSRFARSSPPTKEPKFSATSTLPSSLPGHRKGAPTSLPLGSGRMSNKLSPTSSATNARSPPSQSPGEHPSAGPGLTDDSGYTSSHTNDSVSTPPMSPPDSDLALSPRQSRDSGTWKKLGRLGQWKPSRKKSANFRETETMP